MFPHIVFYGYTARRDLRRPAWDVGNLVINGSGFMWDNNFHYEATGTRYTCPGDCRICSLCKTRGHRHIRVAAH